ncbi:aminopeptidase [Kineosporia sp. J2-2]|uniref:Aminopeptidase n=1 Tax=Kineosporia corallincola TaxID=2835133 RepID=A0ABS5TFN8_9ACTN|nr:aminopeptidase [Kineosporia corallincola]MBT0769909.1 aminopeptidase [Kineosporia corallincola]
MSLIERFADLAVRVGANVQPGQGVVVRSDTSHLEIARAVTEAAYRAGASWVEVEWNDPLIRRSAVTHAGLDALKASRGWALRRIQEWREQGVALITLSGDADPHLFDGLDPVKVAAQPTDELRELRKNLISGNIRWTIVAAPNPGWATQIFGEPDVERLWEAVATAMRLDEDDPVAAWTERSATLAGRARRLDALDLSEIRYVGEGTDLTVGLIPGCCWTGGGGADPSGVVYLPNLPTEEVFTSPDRTTAEGRIRLTKPVVVAGQLVTGLEVTFHDGAITDVRADSGADVVRAQLDSEPGARHLGEVSLVDRDSRIARSGLVFHNTLFDENAGCHVAWGQGFAFAVPGGDAMTPEQLFERGLNQAGVHTDVVIGGAGITVTGRGPGGTVEILRDDEWVLADAG